MQLGLDLPVRTARGREDFMVSASNADAVALLDGWRGWPQGRLALVGPPGSGKSHLTQIWAEETGGAVLPAAILEPEMAPRLAEAPLAVEDADRGVDEAALFHVWNAAARSGMPLLLTGRAAPATWDVALPDLRSRLASLTPATIAGPDDTLLSVLLLKLFADRQIEVRPALIGYLLPRMERSHAAAATLVDRLDREGLARGQAVALPLAREVLGG